ncbi:argininosuccinate lyase [Vulcanisaeta sp. JCM 16161]|uniref:lyase family protein n=1 Tax=Vulcanisaeta sp. JCM 16161 TaxID=1295372 RepID=UPI0006CF3D79|nr:lyase family protein [Vulcanisaeta sp. JCM 16161]
MYRRELLGAGSVDKISYISSVVDDAEIFKYVIIALIVHVNELERIGVINSDAAGRIRNALRDIWRGGYEPGKLGGYEDAHEYIEAELIRRLGSIGGWVGIGRSRNDHVATAIRLRLRRALLDLILTTLRLREIALNKAVEEYDKLIIGSTHRQPAQVTTLGHYMLYLDDLSRDFLDELMHAYELVNRSPLGSGPLAGTMVGIDRFREAAELGFDGVVDNTIYATGSRYFIISAASTIVNYLVEVGRFINNLEMWLMPQLSYVNADPSHLATSSIMPHKRNPATLEVFRARIGEAVGHLMAMYSILRPVESGYQLDLQELTRHMWSIVKIALEGLLIFMDFINSIKVNEDGIKESLGKYVVTAAEYAETIAMKEGRPFRDVYNEVARELRSGVKVGLDVNESLMKPVHGSSNPRQVIDDARTRLNEVRELMTRVNSMVSRLNEIENKLLTTN